MLIDKFETYIINIAGLNDRTTRKKLSKLCKSVQFCDALQFSCLLYTSDAADE